MVSDQIPHAINSSTAPPPCEAREPTYRSLLPESPVHKPPTRHRHVKTMRPATDKIIITSHECGYIKRKRYSIPLNCVAPPHRGIQRARNPKTRIHARAALVAATFILQTT